MAIEANIVPGSQRYLVRTAEERVRAFASAERHTRLVAILRKGLPVFAVLVLASYFISSRLGVSVSVGDLTASIAGIEIADGNLRMVNPKLKGADKKNGQYVIGADYADQDMKNPKLIKLHAIKAELTTDQKGWSRMQAVRGLFNSESERLIMQDDIRVSTSSGVTGRLTHASLEMRKQTLRSHQPVAFDLPSGTVRANALTLNSADKTLLFRGKVRVRIVRVDNKQTASQTPRPPQIKAPDAPARIPPEAPVPVVTEAAPQ